MWLLSSQKETEMVYQFIGSSVNRLGRALLAFAKFLKGATGITASESLLSHRARVASRQSRGSSYAQHLAHKYSRPTRCC